MKKSKTCASNAATQNDQAWSFQHWQKQLLFLCKRGNLESELLLKPYILSLKPTIKSNQTQLIERFLSETEQDIFHWLLLTKPSNSKPVSPTPQHYKQLIKEIRDNYLNTNV